MVLPLSACLLPFPQISLLARFKCQCQNFSFWERNQTWNIPFNIQRDLVLEVWDDHRTVSQRAFMLNERLYQWKRVMKKMVHRLKPPNMIERGRLQWPVHRIRDWKTLLQIPALPFTSCEVLGKSLTSQIMIILIIIHKCYITIKSHINITANGVTEKVVKKKKKHLNPYPPYHYRK